MRTLFLVKDFPPDLGGVQALMAAMAAHWPGEVRVIACRAPGDAEHDRAYPLPVSRIAGFSGWPRLLAVPLRQIALLIAVFALWRAWRFERIVCGYMQFAGPVAHLWRLVSGTGYVLVVHGSELLRVKRSPIAFFWRRLLRRADLVSTTADMFNDFIAGFAPGSRVAKRVVGFDPPGAAPPDLPKPYRGHILTGRRVVLSAGRLVPRKGFDMTLRAAAMLAEKRPEIIAVIAGGGPDEARLKTLARDLRIEDRVIFTGRIPVEELHALYRRADVFAMPSRLEGDDVEGFGIVYLEAGAFGTPVVGGRSGGVPEVVRDGVNGFLADPLDPADIAEKIARILDDPLLARRMGEEGRRLVREVFTHENMVRSMLKDLELGDG